MLFHPGILVALGSGFTFAGRAAFERSGRSGLTPVIDKTVKKGKKLNLKLSDNFKLPVIVSFNDEYGIHEPLMNSRPNNQPGSTR